MTAEQAMSQSERQDEIVTLPFSEEAYETLTAECDGSVSANGVEEFWANDPESETKMTWRVHLTRETESA